MHHAGDRPDEADHFTGDRGGRSTGSGHHHLGLAGSGQAAIAVAQSQLRTPGNVAHRLGQMLDPIKQLSADPGLHATGRPSRPLGPFDQNTAGKRTSGFGDAATADALAARIFRRDQAEIGHRLAEIGEAREVPVCRSDAPRVLSDAEIQKNFRHVTTHEPLLPPREAISSVLTAPPPSPCDFFRLLKPSNNVR